MEQTVENKVVTKSITEKPSKIKQRVLEGNCALCGEWAYPYYYCDKCRIKKNITRVLREFEKKGWVDVEFNPNNKPGYKKLYKWNDSAPEKMRHISPDAVAKMSLPRLNGKPMTKDVLNQAILDVLTVNEVPLTAKEIERGVKSLKTIGKVIPETQQLITEYQAIQLKKSNLSKSQRNAVEAKINFLLKQGAITIDQL